MNNFISVIALFDEEGREKIEFYQDLIKETDLDNRLPHMTLAVYDEPIEVGDFLNLVDDFCKSHTGISIYVNSMRIFNQSSICFTPILDSVLNQFYLDFHRKYKDKCRPFFSPFSESWFPHIGLMYTKLDDAKKKLTTIMDTFEDFELRIESLRVTRKTSNGFEVVHEVKLNTTSHEVDGSSINNF
ncbi:hypothetical protein EZV73_23635 [Acidaminobacter sp. JC074]|uniref:2'-5' RNA ligase family protein n=1 Tax=Acidaminobacter sp. JC074 TaxID=2530199 RepID=UPI001F10826F|nr:2'-5' RNA ligase family protein [Acidaminobacter sp. JC074]MCH4890594.1 hypothetical protein [Acidaminobacter sp. JC074]